MPDEILQPPQIAEPERPDLTGMAQGLAQPPPSSKVPKQNMSPNIVNLFKNLAMAGHGNVVDGVPQRPATKSDAFQAFLGDFLSSFATGMGAAGTGPGANSRGFAAAMGAPRQNQLQNYALEQQAQGQQFNQQQQAENQQSLMGLRDTESTLNLAQAQRALTPTQSQDTNTTEFEVWKQQNPNAPIAEWFKLKGSLNAPTQPSELQQWLTENPGKKTTDYLKLKADMRVMNRVEGLTPSQLSQVSSLSKSFDTNPVIRNLNESYNHSQTIKNIVGRGLGGPGDLAIVFDFMRALDPTSVVRESEYATAAKSGNIFLGTMAKFNGYLKEEGGFLPENVKRAFNQIVDQKVAASNKQAKAMYVDYARRIDNITKQKGTGQDYLTDYSEIFGQAFPAVGGEPAATTTPTRPPGVPPEAVWNEEARQWRMPNK